MDIQPPMNFISPIPVHQSPTFFVATRHLGYARASEELQPAKPGLENEFGRYLIDFTAGESDAVQYGALQQ